MASIFSNKGSKWIYISYLDKNGERVKENTGYSKDDPGDRIQAKRLAIQKTAEESEHKRLDRQGGKFSEWVLGWIESRYGNSPSKKIYVRRWLNLQKFLDRKRN